MNFRSNPSADSSRKKKPNKQNKQPVLAEQSKGLTLSPPPSGNAPNNRALRKKKKGLYIHIQTSLISKIQNKTLAASPAATRSAAIWRDEHMGGMQEPNPPVEEWSPPARGRRVFAMQLVELDPVRSRLAFARCYMRVHGTEAWGPWSPQTASCRFRSLSNIKCICSS